MTKKSENYVIDFVIPSGEIGPTGPTGPGIEQNICFISYTYKTSNGYLNIESNRLIPSNTSNYIINGNKLTIKPGLYEITYCGSLKKTGPSNSQATLDLVTVSENGATTVLPDMGIYLGNESQSTYFSTTTIFEFPKDLDLYVQLVQLNATSVEADSVNVIIKRLN